jgi:fibronectin-binding autotransporter adhesin
MTNLRQSKITTLFPAIAVLAIAALALPRHAAAQVTWTGTSGGDWNTGANWSTGSKPTTGTALFNTTLTSVANAVANQTITSISFDTNAGTAFGGFTVGTPGGNTLTLGNGGTIQILSTLTGTAKAISVNAPLVLSPASASTAGSYTFANNNSTATNTLNFGGPISGGTTSNTVTLNLAGANMGTNTISGAITNGSATTFNVTKTGTGTWFLSGANTYNGNTTISGGTLQVNAGAGGSLSSSSTLRFDTANGAFILDNTGATGAINQSLLVAGSWTGGDKVIQINRAAAQNLTLTLSAAGTAINDATLNYVTSGTPGVNGTDSKIVITAGSAGALGGNSYFNGSNFAYRDAAGYVRGINYGVDGSTATSSGAASIASPATYQQVTGAVTAQNTASFSNLLISGANDFTLAASQTATITNLLKSGGGATTISAGSGITLGASNNYWRVDSASDSLTVSNAIGGTGSRFVKSGKGTLILSGSNTYSSNLIVNDGVVNIQNANALGTTAGSTSVGGALQIQGGITVTGETLGISGMGMNNDGALRNISGDNTWAGLINAGSTRINSDSGTLAITGGIGLSGAGVTFGGAGNISVSGNINNNGPRVVKDGSGTLTLSGTNTWVSGFTIQEGAVSIATINNRNASGPLGVTDNLSMGGTATAGTLSYTGANGSSTMPFTLNAGGGNFEVTNAATALTLSGQITGTGGLTKSGSGTLILTNSFNPYGGSTTINGGTLQVSGNIASNRIGSSPQLILNGGTLYTVATSSLGSGSGVTLSAGGGTFQTDSGQPLTIAGVVSGSGSLTKTGTGNLTLSGSNTFNGTTTVSAGTLALGNNLALQNSALDTAGAGVVTTTGFTTPTLGGLKGSTNLSSVITTGYGSVTALTLNPGIGVTNTYSGAIANGAANMTLTKTGAGTQVLAGVNTYSGATTINGGRLQVDSAGSIGSTSAVVINGLSADLRWNSATAFDRPLTFTQGTISGTGTIGVPVTVAANTFISPGNSPGLQAYTSGLTWASGGTYLWEINNWTGTTAGTDFDQVAVSGSPLDISATSGSPFTINITSLTGSNTAGAVGNWSETSKTFTIATAGSLTNFSADKFSLNTSAFSPTFTGSWSITGTGNALQLNYTALPSTTTGSYSLAASAVSSTIIVGGTSNISSVITNTGTGTADTLNYGPLTVTYAGGTTSLTGSGLALAQGASGTATGGFTNNTAGTYTLTPAGTVTNATLGGAATLGTVTSSTVTVLNHSNAALSLASGGGQTIITGGTFGAVTFNLTNAGSNNAAVQVDGLVNLSGSTGSAVVASGGSVSYTGTGLDNTLIGVNNLLVSATAGDQQSLSGASALTTISATTSYTVLDHATSSLLGSSVSTSTTLNLGEWDYLTQTWTSGTSSAGFSVFNLASVNGDALTALLALTSSTSSGDAGFSTNLNTYSQIAGGGSQGFSVSFDPTGISTSGTYSRIFTINMADQQNLSGAAATNTLTVAANVIVVPEPGAIALAGIGIAAAAYALRRRR